MMVSNVFRPSNITLVFFHNTHGNTFIKSEFITLRVEKIFSMNSIFEMYAKLGGQSRITYAVSYCIHICKIYEKYS